MEAILAAVDVTGLTAGVQVILMAGVGVLLAFVGYRYAKKATGRL
jgi:membrane protein implicated in regulation of membrane protease activity